MQNSFSHSNLPETSTVRQTCDFLSAEGRARAERDPSQAAQSPSFGWKHLHLREMANIVLLSHLDHHLRDTYF